MQKLLDKAGSVLASHLVRGALSFTLPIFVPLGIALLGVIQKTPWAVTAAATVAAFWFCLSAVSQFDGLYRRFTAKWKLTNSNTEIVWIRDPESGAWKGLAIRLYFQNISDFPIEYKVSKVEAHVAGRINAKPEYINRGGIVDPVAFASFTTAAVALDNLTPGDEVSGEWSVLIEYGRVGSARHKIEKRFHVTGRVGAQREAEHLQWFSLPIEAAR
ncbi:hypothetical protein [Caulobacter sp. NIBR2454]|uniref:hypothetical protein n=1 Tax=Caulobacter sp. NIBR2454 TaxID=3015996 RepID=UPI0022B60BD2|nr:hypothetical protein [Caulobacter sp. NIBR2454]